jgi:hypothetical protein
MISENIGGKLVAQDGGPRTPSGGVWLVELSAPARFTGLSRHSTSRKTASYADVKSASMLPRICKDDGL